MFRRVALTATAAQVDRMLEDRAGGLLVDDLHIASSASHRALDLALQIALLARGDLHSGGAVTWRQIDSSLALRDHADVMLAAASSDFASQRWPSFGDARSAALARCRLASMITNASVMQAWDTPVDELSFASDSVVVKSGRLQVSPFHTIIRLSDSIGIKGLEKGMRVNLETAAFWLGLDDPFDTGSEYEQRFSDAGLLQIV